MRAFRFSVHGSRAASATDWVAKARRAEELGYDTFLVPDHLRSGMLSPISALATVAAVTTRLRMGPYVFANDFRHPLLMAREAATLDFLSGGRLELGLGAGWMVSDYRQLGLPYDPPGRRIDRLVEALGIVKRLFAGETVTHHGPAYVLDRARLSPTPIQRPPPLHIGAGGPRMLRLAAREADIVGLVPQFSRSGRPMISDAGEAATARKVEIVRQAAGNRFGSLVLSAFVADAGMVGSRQPLPASLVAATKAGATALVSSPYVLYGTRRALRDRLERRRERLGINAYAIPLGHMEAMAPLVDDLAGR